MYEINSAHTKKHMLGSDGRFNIFRDVMGVPGLHLAVNVFSEAAQTKLYNSKELFVTGAQPFMKGKEGESLAILRTRFHPLHDHFPGDLHRMMNALRDCGLFPQAIISNCVNGLTYPPATTGYSFSMGRVCGGGFSRHVNGTDDAARTQLKKSI